jgi:hypothetical protein
VRNAAIQVQNFSWRKHTRTLLQQLETDEATQCEQNTGVALRVEQ